MLTHTPIPGIRIEHTPEAVHIHSQAMMTTLSSSFLGGGFRRVRHILNAWVRADYGSNDPVADLQAIAQGCGVDAAFVGLLTAVPLRRMRAVFSESEGLRVGAVVTAGVGNATCAGRSPPHSFAPGTINIVVLVDARLTRAAMVNAVITATEAKTATLADMKIRTPEGDPATGTSTDTVTVAMTGTGKVHPYAGPVTLPGWLIANTVREAVRASLLAE